MRVPVIAAIALILAASSPAHADEDDRMVSLLVGFGAYTIPDHSPQGAVVGVEYERGFSDSMALRASAQGGYFFVGGGNQDNPDPDNSFTGQATIGITYFLDVLKYVPYANLGAGAVYIGGGPGDGKLNALVEFGVGLDILHSRELSYGVQARFDSFAQETSVFTAGVRATYRWGFF